MSVSLLEVIERGGYSPWDSADDANWLISKQEEFSELVEQAENFLEELEGAEDEDNS